MHNKTLFKYFYLYLLLLFCICYIIVTSSKRRNPQGFEGHSHKKENKNLKSTLSDPIGPPSNDLPPHSPLLASLSDANNTHKINANNKTINPLQPHKSKAHSKRARNRSLEMVIDDEKADSSPSRSR